MCGLRVVHHPSVTSLPVAEWSAWWQQNAGAEHATGLVCSPDELAAAGVSRQTARTQVRRGAWVNASFGFIAMIDVTDAQPFVVARRRHALRAAAAARRRSGHVISGRSAAILDGLPTLHVPLRPELTEPCSVGLGRERRGAHVYGAELTSDEIAEWFGVPVTTVSRTLVDLARHDERDAIMATDAALREGLITPGDITTALGAAIGWPGVRKAREVLATASGLAESPLESLTRLALRRGGFPMPELQVWIGDFRVDMLFREQRVILEIDGLQKYSDEEWRREKRRETRLRQLGYRVERITWDDVVKNWPRTEAWLRSVLRLPARVG